MQRPNKSKEITDTRLIGYWNGSEVPVYDITSMHGLNQMVGYVKHINGNEGTVLYRGQTKLYNNLKPSILHREQSSNSDPSDETIKKRNDALDLYIERILSNSDLSNLLHFEHITDERILYKKYVVEAMLQHYGVSTYFQDFVDNHWVALWFGLNKFCSEKMENTPKGSNYLQFYYEQRDPVLKCQEEAPSCLRLLTPEEQVILPEFTPSKVNAKSTKSKAGIIGLDRVMQLWDIKDYNIRQEKFDKLYQETVNLRKGENERRKQQCEERAEELTASKREAYLIDKKSDIAYLYLLLYLADTRGENFKGSYTGTETIALDLRKALPSVLLRPCAQHGWVVKRLNNQPDLSNGVVCVLRLKVSDVSEMMGNGSLLSQENFFPSPEHDWGYRLLLEKEAPISYSNDDIASNPGRKYVFPFATLQHFVEKP